jgi:hypothetical protein
MSSLVGIGVADTVVLTAAVETGPTKRSQRPSTSRVRTVVKAVGFATPLPLREAVGVGVAMIVVGRGEVEFWDAASPASTGNESSESFMIPSVNLAR